VAESAGGKGRNAGGEAGNKKKGQTSWETVHGREDGIYRRPALGGASSEPHSSTALCARLPARGGFGKNNDVPGRRNRRRALMRAAHEGKENNLENKTREEQEYPLFTGDTIDRGRRLKHKKAQIKRKPEKGGRNVPQETNCQPREKSSR